METISATYEKHVAKVRVLVNFANKTTKKICFLTRFNTFVLFVKDEDFFYLLVFCLFYI